MILQVLTRAGIIVNQKKSDLNPTQDLVYIEARFSMDLNGQIVPTGGSDRRAPSPDRSFSRVGQFKPDLLYLSLLGLMAATLQMVEYGHLHMCTI